MITEAKAHLQWDWEACAGPHSRAVLGETQRPLGGYGRDHEWLFGCGARVPVTDRLLDVPTQCFDSLRPSSEEAFVAAVASSHMMAFLALAAEEGINVMSYFDKSSGILAPDEEGEMRVSEIVLSPKVTYGEAGASPGIEQQMHEEARRRSILGNSITAKVTIYSAAVFTMAAR